MSITCENCAKICKSLGGLRTHQRVCLTAKAIKSPVDRVRPINLDDDFNPIKPISEPTSEPATQEPSNEIMLSDLKEHSAVSNKEALKDKIHEIHNYLRNHGAGYGMNALKVFNIVYGLKKIEEAGLIDKAELKRPECEFSYILKLAKVQDNGRVADLIFDDALNAIAAGPMRDMLLYEIPQNIKPEVISWLVREVEKIAIIEKSCNVLLSGKVYEYFIGRDDTAISELGAYFTDRHIVDFIISKVDPQKTEDGQIPSMIDMFGGSGGFTTGYINYLNTKYAGDIPWETEIDKIYHSDINQDVLKSAALEIFCLTGQFPNLRDNIRFRNAFTHEFAGIDNKPRKYKYVLTNPPYGGDKNIKTGASIKRAKIRDYITRTLPLIKDDKTKAERMNQLKEINDTDKLEKFDAERARVTLKNCSARIQKFAKTYGVTGNDKESCSLMLLMDTVELGGVGVGVLKEGVFFNRLYADLRRCLIRNFAVREIISIDADQFENTSTKTSILIFDNHGKPTSEVRFSRLMVNKYTEDKFGLCNGKVCLVENTGDISDVYQELVSVASIGEILKHPMCSLNGRDYNKPVLNIGADYTLVKLGDICDINYGTRITERENTLGPVPVYGGGNIMYHTDKANRSKNTLIISRFGMSKTCVRLINKDFYLSDSGLSLHTKNKEHQNFINFILINKKMQDNIYYNCTVGSIQRQLNIDQFKSLGFPIPKDAAKLAAWVAKISEPYNMWQTTREQIKAAEVNIAAHIAQITSGECDQFELGTLCDIKSGQNLTKANATPGKYKVYGGGNTSYTHNVCNVKGPNIVISRVGNSNLTIVYDDFYLTDNGLSLIFTDDKYKKYICYLLKNNNEIIVKMANGTAQKLITQSQMRKFAIKLPKNKQLIADLDPLFAQLEQLNESANASYTAYQKLSDELSDEAMPKKDMALLSEDLDA